MATLNQEDAEVVSLRRPAVELPRVSWKQILAISIFALALNFHWSAIGFIIIPSQVLKIVGDLNKGTALAFVLVPGAFISLIANPLFGWLSDRTSGRFAAWGSRRPYILIGTLVNIAALVWMATSRDIVSLMMAYVLVQLSSNAAMAPFHALLPDMVPSEQRGLTSGVIGGLGLAGTIVGALVAGMFIDANKPLAAYQQGLWIVYGIIMITLLVFMLITIISVRERALPSRMRAQALEDEAKKRAEEQTAQDIVEQPQQQREVPSVGQQDEVRAHQGMGQQLAHYLEEQLDHSMEAQQEHYLEEAREQNREESTRKPWISRFVALTIAGTLGAVLIVWGLMTLWNMGHIAGIQISGDAQQVVLELIVAVGVLRIFDFNPRRDPDFAWVLATRLVMMMGIYTIQDFLQYYMRDDVGVAHPEQATTNFVIIVSFTSLFSAFAAGWLSDRFGRKRLVYVSGVLMALVGLIFILTHSFPVVIAAGAIFGLGYGAYQSVDWALVADTLPSDQSYARDMGIWNIALSVPQVIAPVLGGPLIDWFTREHNPVFGFQLIFMMAIVYCIIGTVTVRFIRGVKN